MLKREPRRVCAPRHPDTTPQHMPTRRAPRHVHVHTSLLNYNKKLIHPYTHTSDHIKKLLRRLSKSGGIHILCVCCICMFQNHLSGRITFGRNTDEGCYRIYSFYMRVNCLKGRYWLFLCVCGI